MRRYVSIFSEEYAFDQIDKEKTYNMFTTNYMKTTGQAWDRDTFMYKSQDYLFFGDDEGYLMVRPQQGNIYKLVGSAGNFRSVVKGIKELLALNKPVWGMVSKELVAPAQRYGFINPPSWFIKLLFTQIPIKKFAGSATDVKLNSDGSITVKYPGFSKDAIKYFIANKEYFYWLLDKLPSYLPSTFRNTIQNIIDSSI